MNAPASIVTRRRLEWSETDPMNRWHYGAALRFLESAETELHRRLGVGEECFRRMPRLNVTVDFLGPLHYGEVAEIHLAVDHVGRSSLRYAFALHRWNGPAADVAPGEMLARGMMTVAWYDPQTRRSARWPEHLHKLFTASGPQPAGPDA